MSLNKISKSVLYCSALLFVAAVSFTACKNDDDDGDILPAQKTGFAEDQLVVEHIYNNIDRVVERAMNMGSGALKGGDGNALASCAKVTKDSSDKNRPMMTIDFGKLPCLGFDGRYRSGKVIVKYSGDKVITDKGYSQEITFDGYMIDDHRVYGKKEIWNTGSNLVGELNFEVARHDSVYLPNDGGWVTGESQRTRTWYRGTTTPQTSDDVYRLSGFGNFKTASRDNYRVLIAKPLVLPVDCNWITEGVLEITPEGSTKRVLDYGRGECEGVATLNINGTETTKNIP